MSSKETYLDLPLKALPRVLTALNRTESMESFGCFDRNWWHYKITDFPSARMQEGVLTLAILWKEPWSPHRHNKQFLKWIEAAIDFWIKRQHRDGSVEEWYPGERSFVATAFSLYAVSETLLLIPELVNENRLKAVCKAADFLASRYQRIVFNQNSGAMTALYNTYLLTKDKRYDNQGAVSLARDMERDQSKEGWFSEYGGADIGYLSLTIDYVGKYYRKSDDPNASIILNRALDFISHFIHPDGSAGGIYGSRNTAYIIPSGFEVLASEFPVAAAIAAKIREGYQSGALPTPETLDERYLLQNGYTFLQAYGAASELANVPMLPSGSVINKNFSEARILVKSDQEDYLVVNYKKGGVFYFYNKAKKEARWGGGLVLKKGGEVYISGSLQTDSRLETEDPRKFLVRGHLVKESEKTSSPFTFFLLRFAHTLFSLLPRGEELLKGLLRKVLISGRERSGWEFSRSFEIKDGKLEVKDSYPESEFEKLYSQGCEEFIYVPSSRLFIRDTLTNKKLKSKEY